MAEANEAPESPTKIDLISRLRGWVGGDSRRNVIVGVGFAIASIATIMSWLTVAEIAAAPEEATVERALDALDAGDEDLARSIVANLQDTDALSASDYGGALFVLGTLKSRDAERQWSDDRSRSDYFIASKYLNEARAIGFPDGRVAEGLFLLGKSLIESRQLSRGVEVLNAAIEAGARGQARAHLLLAEAHLFAPTPDYEKAIEEIDAAIGDAELGAEERSAALLHRAEALAALGRGAEARETVQNAGGVVDAARRALVEGKAIVAQLSKSPRNARRQLANEANNALSRARRADQLATSVTRESDYLRAKIAELVGRRDEALAAYDDLRRSHGASPAGVAAAFAEGALHQAAGDEDEALPAYRRALDSIEDVSTYRNPLLPLSEARLQVKVAHDRFLAQGRFAAAQQLTEWVGQLLGRTEQLALQAETLRQWGETEIEQARTAGSRKRSLVTSGRRHLREAGIAYERLADARFATRDFTEDLWMATETLQRGQAYSAAIRVLDRYLYYEPVKRNALALLRLGEAQLARGEDEQAIAAFDECLEFHETDASSYRVRVAAADAHRGRGDFEQAEALLRHNLTRTALTPNSPEWRDSKFALGRLLVEADRHDEAIAVLEEAITRYPDDGQSRSARYQIAMAHRHAAREPLEQLRQAKTVNERELARARANAHLEAALTMFQSVQQEITLADSNEALDRVTLRNCFMLGGDVLFELGRYDEARQSFASVSTLYQNEPYMLEALVSIYHCWRRQSDRPKARGVIQQARQLLERLPSDANFANSTNLNRSEWDRLLAQLDSF